MVANRIAVLFVAVGLVAAAGVAFAAFPTTGRGATTSTSGLPPYCVKPANGFLIVASSQGFNDSIGHGVPTNLWPWLDVTKGSVVKITVCNTDRQAHGFQVQHYLESPVNAIAPGQAVTFSFVVDETGLFQIYCSIPCTIHWAMRSGVLVVR